MLELPGWTPLKAPARGTLWQKWAAVKSEVLQRPAGVKDMTTLHAWARRNVTYTPETGDDWQGPKQTLARGRGDCEDYAVLERAALLSIGYKESQIYVVVAYDAVARQDHAVVFCGDYFLDCRSAEVQHKSRFRDYRPVYAFQQGQMFLYGRVR